MYINISIYNELIKMSVAETCGFIYGNVPYFDKYFIAKNISKNKDEYKIGILDRLKCIWKMLESFSGQYIVFHVHDNFDRLSDYDIEIAERDSMQALICNGKMKLYKIKLYKEKKIACPIGLRLYE